MKKGNIALQVAVLALVGYMLVNLDNTFAANFVLAWDPNTEPDLAGYKLHYGTTSGVYSTTINVGNVTQFEVTGLQDGITYYFAVTAYDFEGYESGYSNEVSARKNISPAVSATASPLSGQVPLQVAFQAQATDQDGSIVSFLWDFGDGSNSSLQNPSHTYSKPGTYTAKVTVTDNDGATSTATLLVQALPSNQPPTVNVTASPTSGKAPLTVMFFGSGVDQDGVVTGYLWSFGDGSTSTQQTVSHTYQSQGTYEAVLTVTDDKGATASKAIQITVYPANVPPMLNAEATPTKGSPPLTVTFRAEASDPDGQVVSLLWDFGDGVTSQQASVQHTYLVEGTYTAYVKVKDNDGAEQSKSFTIRVNAAPHPPRNLKVSRK